MLDFRLLKDVRYVVDSRGKKAPVLLDLKAWEALLSYLEEIEDRALVKEALGRLNSGPQISGAISWDEAGQEW
jgi:hypothetical protein